MQHFPLFCLDCVTNILYNFVMFKCFVVLKMVLDSRPRNVVKPVFTTQRWKMYEIILGKIVRIILLYIICEQIIYLAMHTGTKLYFVFILFCEIRVEI